MFKLPVIPKAMLADLKKAEVKEISVTLGGGSDEAYMMVEFVPENLKLRLGFEEWLWETMDYSGAGDGSDYGDDILIDLEEMCITQSEWYLERVDGPDEIVPIEVEEDENQAVGGHDA